MSAATETEGVIKFDLTRIEGPGPDADILSETLIWRAVLFRLELTGQTAGRYGGLAYGNISRRLTGNSFAISGTQTGGIPHLAPEDFCVIEDFDLDRNAVIYRGPVAPSSEALTHAAVYLANPSCQCVIHVHSPQIWRHFKARGLPATSARAAYGTLALAHEAGLLAGSQAAGAFAMHGHQDGIIAYSGSTEAAACRLLHCLGAALTQDPGA
jgi:hypothetical protein